MPSTTTEKVTRTPEIIDGEISKLHAQRPMLEQQVQAAARRVKEIEVALGDLFVRSLCDETPQPPEQLAALEQERQAAMAHATTLDRALGQFGATLKKLEKEKDAIIHAGKRAERDAVLIKQQALARELDKLFAQSVMPNVQVFLEQTNQIYGLSSEIGEAPGATPKTRLMRVLQSLFGATLHPAMERIGFRVGFTDITPKQ